MTNKQLPISFFEDISIKNKLKRAAKYKGVTLSALIRMIVREYLKKNK